MNIALIITLLVVGICLLLIEIFVVPGVGIAGILGVGSMVAACVLSFTFFGATQGWVITSLSILLLILLIWYALRENTWKRFTLNTKVEGAAGQASSQINVGDEGVTLTRLAPMGTARIADRTLEVKSASGFLDNGTEIVVDRIEDNIIYVTKKM